ncbi:caspase family protein [Rubrivirga sp. IMCC43871]|uniref:nSTAND1 domain-containing NTPase n=1 Tax=Rubrivirga sp. IMCC43871 TaxID=3391575 RepID=UPI00399028DC
MAGRPDFQQSVAVVIGIDAYTDGVPALQTPASDARRLGHLLGDDHGYDVRLLLDGQATLAAIEGLLADLARDLGSDDRMLFYFAGHGVALDGDDGPTGYLVPQDARLHEAETYLHMPALNEALSAIKCRHMLVVLDSCFSGAFRWSSTRALMVLPEVIHQERYDRFILDPAWQALASASHDQTALDALPGTFGDRGEVGGHSPFAQALFDALEGAGDLIPKGDGDGVITASELYLYLEHAVQPATIDAGNRQTPRLWPLAKHDKGEFIFLVPGHELNLPPAPPLTFENNPWRGLESYDEEHAPLFFGRDDVIKGLEAHVEEHSLTIVLGASGTGKSSVVKAGLVPRLKRDEGRAWHILPVVRPGADPGQALEQAVAELGTGDTVEERIAAWCAATPDTRLVLIVDQFEELVTMTREAEAREATLALLLRLVKAHPKQLRLILTLRSDFEPQFDGSVLKAHWKKGGFRVPPMTQDEIRGVIEKPASQRVMYFEPHGLVDKLINEVILMPGGLPLLSFALSEMYRHYVLRDSDDRAIEEADYDAVGGVVGALRTRADAEYEALGMAHQETMRRLMLRMVASEGGNVARRRVPCSELEYPDKAETKRALAVIKKLTKARLVVVEANERPDVENSERPDVDSKKYVEPAHDALVNAWKKLTDWIRAEENRAADLHFQRRLTRAAQEWAGADSDRMRKGVLWRDSSRAGLLLQQVVREERTLRPEALTRRRRLARAIRQAWRRLRPAASADAEEGVWMNRTELDFARASIRRRGQARIVFAVVVALIAIIAAIAFYQAGIARQERDIALSRYYISQANAALDRDPVEALVFAIAAAEATDSVSTQLQSTLFQALQEPHVRREVDGHEGQIVEIDFDAQGERFVSTGLDGWARVWDFRTGEPVAAHGGPSDRLRNAWLSPDGRRLAAISDSTLRIWEVDSDAPPVVLAGTWQWDDGLEWSSGSRRVLTFPNRGAIVQVWDAITGNVLASLEPPSQQDFIGAALAIGGRVVTRTSRPLSTAIVGIPQTHRQRVHVWEGEVRYELPTDVSAMAVSPNGEILATFGPESPVSLRGMVRLWDLTSARLIGSTSSEVATLDAGLRFSPDGDVLAVAAQGGVTVTFNVNRPGLIYRREDASLQDDATYFDPRNKLPIEFGRGHLVSVDRDGRARLWGSPSLSPLEQEVVLNASTPITRAAVSPDGLIVTASVDGSLRFWDVHDAPTVSLTEAERERHHETLSAGDGLFVRDGSVYGPGEEELFADSSIIVREAAAFPDGGRVALVDDDNVVRVVALKDGRVTGQPIPLGVPLRSIRVEVSPNGRYLLLRGSTDESPFGTGVPPFIVDLETHKVTALSPPVAAGLASYVSIDVFSPDSEHILTASHDDNILHVWQWRTSRLIQTYYGHSRTQHVRGAPSIAACFSPGSTRVVSMLSGTARVWDVNTGQDLAVIEPGSHPLAAAMFSSDGQRVVALDQSGGVRVYTLDVDEMVAIAKARLPVTMTEAERQRILAQ